MLAARSMLAARLQGPMTIKLDEVPAPGAPGAGEVRLAVTAVGVCGSDLHAYKTGNFATGKPDRPLTMGHEFAAVVLDAGPNAVSGFETPLVAGQRVAVEPNIACGHCRQCREGNPNLCTHHRFLGVWPDDGALQEELIVPAENCFPIPDAVSDAAGAQLEVLGVALHALDLGKVRVGDRVGVVGCGPVGLLIARLAHLAGAAEVVTFDPLPWRAEMAARFGATSAITGTAKEPGVNRDRLDVVFEVAWANESAQQAASLCRAGGRLVLVGIPEDNRLVLEHANARRKGLTIMMARRMKHTFERALSLVERGQVDLDAMATVFPFAQASEAFRQNASYHPGLIKAVITPRPQGGH